MLTDPIADMLTRIRNAHLALHKDVQVPRSKMKEALAAILKQEGYVEDVAVADKNITIALRYEKGRPVITGLKRVSTPGRRVYVGAHPDPQGAERPRHLHIVHVQRCAGRYDRPRKESGRRTFVRNLVGGAPCRE